MPLDENGAGMNVGQGIRLKRLEGKAGGGTYLCIQVPENWSVADTDRNLEKFKREQGITDAAKIDILTSKDVEQIIPVYAGDIGALFAQVAAYGKRLGCG